MLFKDTFPLSEIMKAYPECKGFLKANGFDDAIIGVDNSVSKSEPKLIYSIEKSLEILMEHMDYEEAVEFFDFNVMGSYVGVQTPIWKDDRS